ncbi:MAG: NAD(P) transhydrogenase subunit alpha [Firmicutes bacterium]|nr:NAD(P) transhydrogenase subunit alpha [Bacillota bacterium]
MTLLSLLVIFIVASLVGYKVISDVPALLHTPLMSGTNALSGVTLLGALTITALATATGYRFLGAVAIILAMINVVGGFLVTHRMLRMFKK